MSVWGMRVCVLVHACMRAPRVCACVHLFRFFLNKWGKYPFLFCQTRFSFDSQRFFDLTNCIFHFFFQFKADIVYILWIHSMQDKILYNLKENHAANYIYLYFIYYFNTRYQYISLKKLRANVLAQVLKMFIIFLLKIYVIICNK